MYLLLHSLKSKKIIGSNIDVFYISIEDSYEIWSKEVKDFNHSMKPQNSFKIVNDNMKSSILKYFNIRYQCALAKRMYQ